MFAAFKYIKGTTKENEGLAVWATKQMMRSRVVLKSLAYIDA